MTNQRPIDRQIINISKFYGGPVKTCMSCSNTHNKDFVELKLWTDEPRGVIPFISIDVDPINEINPNIRVEENDSIRNEVTIRSCSSCFEIVKLALIDQIVFQLQYICNEDRTTIERFYNVR